MDCGLCFCNKRNQKAINQKTLKYYIFIFVTGNLAKFAIAKC